MTYKVLDTNLILLDAHNIVTLGRDGSTIVLPETVLDEIDSKKSGHTELAFQAREFGRLLTKANDVSTRSTETMMIHTVSLDGTLIELVSLVPPVTFDSMPENVINDRKIIHVAYEYQRLGLQVIFMTNDIACKHRAKSLGLNVQELKEVESTDFTFTCELSLPYALFLDIHNKPIDIINPNHKPEYYNYKFTTPESNQVKFAYLNPSGLIQVIGKETEKEIRDAAKQPAPPLNSEQLMLSRAILDPSIDVIIAEARAGSGKTITALSNAMRLVATNTPYEGIVYIRASVSDLPPEEEVGFLPGLEEKFAPYLHPIKDSLDFIARKQKPRHKGQKIEEYEEMIESYVQELTTKHNITAMIGLGLRGRTFNNSIIIIDEVQNMSKASLQKVLTRVGKNCKVILIGSQRQIDNPYVNKFNNGLSIILNSCTIPNSKVRTYAITLESVVRSDICEWSESIFSA